MAVEKLDAQGYDQSYNQSNWIHEKTTTSGNSC
jgi:hypothetical protein